jgi:hypothetical protein
VLTFGIASYHLKVTLEVIKKAMCYPSWNDNHVPFPDFHFNFGRVEFSAKTW